MRAILFLAVFLAFAVPAYADDTIYICPMHPHIQGHKGDTCPICGMTLVPKSIEDHPSDKSMTNSKTEKMNMGVSITPEYVQALGVKTTKVEKREIGQEFRAYGRVMPDQGRSYQLDLKAEGWVVDLKVLAVGDQVKEGDLLFTFYSPDLMTAQSDYLIALKSGAGIASAQNRLRLFGMNDLAIADLRKAGQVMQETPFYAPQNGAVTYMNITKGAHVAKGQSALKIDDLSSLWVMADVEVKDASGIK